MLAGVSIFPGPAQAALEWGAVFAYVDWTNDYRFYGLSESNRQPAVQGGLHWLAPENFYAGVFASQVRFKDYRGTSIETDFYAGRHFLFDANDLNLELLYGVYPNTNGHPSYAPPGVIYPTYDFLELSGELTHSFGAASVSTKLYWEPSLSRFKPEIWSVNGSASYPLLDWLKVSANLGHQWSSLASGQTHWDIGATATHGWQWAFDVRYYGSDVSRADCFHMNWCAPAVVAKLTYTFAVL
jgi:uncharacterized protein (TIGR02001 family)